MARHPLLVFGSPMPYLAEELAKRYAVENFREQADPVNYLRKTGARFRAVAVSGGAQALHDDLDLFPNLEIISSFGVGTDHLPLEQAKARDIVVANTPDVLNEDTANMAITLLLAASRDIVANDRFVREGAWARGSMPPLAMGIGGKRVGLVGLGRIGGTIARKLLAFGCEVVYHTRTPRNDVPYQHYSDLEQMARDCAVVIAILPGGEATAGIISRNVLKSLGPEGIFINIARGTVVDQDALVEVLLSGELGRAGLDVFADEPNVPEALFGVRNVVLQPHMGSATVETRKAMADRVVENLDRHFAERP
ncbi:MAG: 2-hydroxyacid dehydrogenase [Phyllobacterium sp.]